MKEKIKEILRAVPIAGKTYEEYIEALADKLIAEGVIEVKHGQYTRSDEFDEQYGFLYKCSCCGRLGWTGNYCSYCGAKMDGERGDE